MGHRIAPLRLALAVSAALASLAGTASAQLGDFGGEFDRSGLYVGFGGLYTQNGIIEDQLSNFLPGSVQVDDSWGVNAQLGYRAFSFLAAEVEYEYVDGYDVGTLGVPIANLQGHLLTGNLKLIAPVWRFQPYLLAGVGFVRWDIDDTVGLGFSDSGTDLAGRLGGGIDVHLTSRLSLNAGADVVLTNTSLSSSTPGFQDVDFLGYVSVGAGIQYRFWGLSGR